MDDLLSQTSPREGETSVSENVLNFIHDAIQQCEKIVLLATTRNSLGHVSVDIGGFESARLGPLDETSSDDLIDKFLSDELNAK